MWTIRGGVILAVAFGRPIAPISIIIPCNVEDFHFLPLVLTSIANQTFLPQETILVANLPQPYSDGILLLDTATHSASRRRESSISTVSATGQSTEGQNLFSWLFEKAALSVGSFIPDRREKTDPTNIGDLAGVTGGGPGEETVYPGPPLTAKSIEAMAESTSPFTSGINEVVNLPTQKFDSAANALSSIIRALPDAKHSIAQLPRFKVYIRAGTHYAGNNRVFGGSKATTDIVSFFDADDYMHPQRIERLHRVFDANKDLEALIHGFQTMKITDWPKHISTLLNRKYNDRGTDLVLPYADFWGQLPKHKLVAGQSEPVYTDPNRYAWWFPKDMDLRLPPNTVRHGHNGWLTVKKRVLTEVQYPDIRRGQDSLYNWRLLAARRNWNFLPEILGAYINYA